MARPRLQIESDQIEAMAREGLSNAQISRAFGCDESTIRKRFSVALDAVRFGLKSDLLTILDRKPSSGDSQVSRTNGATTMAIRSDFEPAKTSKQQTSVDKVTRLGWTIIDEPGEFRMIPKSELNVDLDYQREEVRLKIMSIAADWSWFACGVLLVAMRKSGQFYVYDGQQRAAAARKRPDIHVLPCMVFRTEDSAQEAAGYLQVNTNRKPLSAINKFKARILTGDEASTLVSNLITESGYEVTGSLNTGRTVKCIAGLEFAAQVNPDLFRKTWWLTLEVVDGGPVQERIFRTIFFIERKLQALGGSHSLFRSPWRDRLKRLGTTGILDACARSSAYYRRGGDKIWAGGVVEELNKGVKHRLSIYKDAEEDD